MSPIAPSERRRLLRLSSAAVCLVALALGWRYSILSEWLSLERVTRVLETLSLHPWRGPIVVTIFVLANAVLFPVTILIAGTAIAFGASSGFVWALAGSMCSAVAMFGAGHWLGRPVWKRLAGARMRTVADRLARGGLVAVFVMRNVPIAPFTVVNFVAGATPIRFRDYFLGTLLGMTPGIAALIFLGDRLRDVWQHPTAANLGLLVLAVAVWIALALGLQRLSNRISRARRSDSAV
jgi:uncharacterized membrane protein YdjX (TVP38/TMEM64 family)